MSRITSRVLAVTAAIAAAALTLTACSGSGSGSGGQVDTTKLVIGLDSDQAALGYDPLRYAAGQRMFFEGLYDSLFKIDQSGKVVPDLATASSYSADKTQLTLTLDTKAAFSDGSTLTADLVKKNLDGRTDPNLSAYSSFAAGGQNEIKDVKVVDDKTLTLTFATPQPAFESNLVFPGGVIVGEKGVTDRSSLDKAPDGSGPLQLDASKTVKGNTYLLVKKKNDPAAKAYPFNSYEFKPILDPQARVNAALSGEVDTAYITAETQDQVKSAGVGLVANGGTVVNLLPFDKNGTLAPQWGDPRVWKALSIAIDRNAYVKAVHKGDLPTANALPKDNPGYLPSLEKDYAYDPKAAKKLLADAGYPNGFSFDFTITSGSQRDLEAIQPYWKAIGVTVNLKNAASTEQAFAAVKTEPVGGPIPLTWTNPAANVFGVLFGFANAHNASNDQIKGAFGAYGAAGGDTAKQTAPLKDLNKAMVESGWLIPLFEQLSPWAYSTSKLKKPTFPGADSFPILASLTLAS